jgi:DNA-binding MarR family transcriptional regulator
MAETVSAGTAVRTGYRLIKLGELVLATAERALEPLGVRPRHFNVLTVVAANPTISQQDLSRRLNIDANVMVGVIDELERAGFARRQRNPNDRRRHVVDLTEAGLDILRRGQRLLDVAEAELFGTLSDRDRAKLDDIAGRLLAANPPVHKSQ